LEKSGFARAFEGSFKVHDALQSVESATAPGECIDPRKVMRQVRGQDFDLSRSDNELLAAINRAAAEVGLTLKAH
jgi:hypothetical protein